MRIEKLSLFTVILHVVYGDIRISEEAAPFVMTYTEMFWLRGNVMIHDLF